MKFWTNISICVSISILYNQPRHSLFFHSPSLLMHRLGPASEGYFLMIVMSPTKLTRAASNLKWEMHISTASSATSDWCCFLYESKARKTCKCTSVLRMWRNDRPMGGKKRLKRCSRIKNPLQFEANFYCHHKFETKVAFHAHTVHRRDSGEYESK